MDTVNCKRCNRVFEQHQVHYIGSWPPKEDIYCGRCLDIVQREKDAKTQRNAYIFLFILWTLIVFTAGRHYGW